MRYSEIVDLQGSAFEIDEPSVIFEEQDGEIVLVELRGGFYYRIKKPSAGVFNMLVSGYSLAKLQSSCAADGEAVSTVVSDLLDKQLVRPVQEVRGENAPPWELKEFVLEEYGDLQEILKLDPIHEAAPDAGWPTPRT